MNKLPLILSMALALCFTAGCQDRNTLAELEQYRAQAKLEEQNQALVKRYVEGFNRADFEAMKELLSPEYAGYSPSGHPEPASREALIESYQGALEAFSEFNWSIEDMAAAEDKVITRIIARGTYLGGIPNLPKEEKTFQFSMITIMRIVDGKVLEEWQEDDQLGLARQLGMELKPKENDK